MSPTGISPAWCIFRDVRRGEEDEEDVVVVEGTDAEDGVLHRAVCTR